MLMAIATAGTYSPATDQSGTAVWQILGLAGPALLATLLVALLLRAVVRQGRYRVVGAFSEEDRQAVKRAITEAEKRTVGEILPVVVERSDPHPAAEWLAALCFTLVGSTLLAAWLPWDRPALVILAQIGMGLVGYLLAFRLPGFKRLFLFADRATAVAQEQAFQEFYANGLHRTEAATGVLVFVSLLEHRVIVLADEGIDSVVDADFWSDVDDAITEGIRRGSLREGLIAGIRKTGELLEQSFPWKEGDRDEIPDRVIVRKE